MPADEVDPDGRCAVLGSPIAHSLSPILHRAAYTALGLNWEYTAHEVAQGELTDFLWSLDGSWRGLSLTMPLKREVIGLCDEVEPRGRLLQSINTVVFTAGGARRGYNTDVVGMTKSFVSAGVHRLDSVAIVGGGATAASALAAASELGARKVTVLVRSPVRARHLLGLGEEFGVDVAIASLDARTAMPTTDAVISTIPAQAQGAVAAAIVSSTDTVFDVVYHPARTPFLVAAGDAGLRVIPGFELLLHQAGRQVELMTGTNLAPLDEMRSAGMRALDNR